MAYKIPSGPRRGEKQREARNRAHPTVYPPAANEPAGLATTPHAVPYFPGLQPDATQAYPLEREDITHALELEERLRRSEAERLRLDAIVRSMDEALLVVDASGSVVLTNDTYERMFDSRSAAPLTSAADMAGKALAPDDSPTARAAVGGPFNMEFTLTDADGTRRWFTAHGEPIQSADGKRTGGAMTIKDITERNLYSMQNEFVARVSHELGAPLSAIVLSLRLMHRRLRKIEGALATEAQGYTETALWEAERMRVLVGDLVDVSRLQRGRLRLRLQTEDLVTLLRRAVSLAQLGTRTQTFVLDVPDTPVLATGDATRLEQVIVNLLSNALRHAPKSRRIDVRLRTTGDSAELEVQDYGPGIPSASLPGLFDRFSTPPSESSWGAGGLGLGLYITKELVDAHGGRIGVESEEGRGTTFLVQLPLADAPPDDSVCTESTVSLSPSRP